MLTRDRELLKRRSITHGCYVRTLRPREQLREVFERLDLARSAQPFRLCLMCNAPLRRIAKDEVGTRAPDGVLERHNQFVTCDVCRRVFWEGTHWQTHARADGQRRRTRAGRLHATTQNAACARRVASYNAGLLIWQRPSVWR